MFLQQLECEEFVQTVIHQTTKTGNLVSKAKYNLYASRA